MTSESELVRQVELFEAEAHALLAKHEGGGRSRVVTLSGLVQTLGSLTLRQEGLFRQALVCAEYGLFLAAHVMAWAGVMDLFEEKLASDGLVRLFTQYPDWRQFGSSLADVRENKPEYQLLDAGRKIGLLSKGECTTLKGHLHTRNQAAHPTGFEPGLNETLGYIEALLKQVPLLQAKVL